MNRRRIITLTILIAFIPIATGCSRTRVIQMADDPGSSKTHARFADGEPIEINSYTRPDDGLREWRGHVQAVPPDSLQFTGKIARRGPLPAPPFRLARSEVLSIGAREFSPPRTITLGVISIVVLGLAIGGAVFAANGGAGGGF